MDAEVLLDIIGAGFYAGVPDSHLKALCDCLSDKYGTGNKKHIIAANEGNAVSIAAGYYLATENVPAVYMQNSGEGNIINPVASLLNEKVYGIPVVFIIGWRGEPGVHDEPQHIYQGEVTVKLLDDMGIDSFVIDTGTSESLLRKIMGSFQKKLDSGKAVAFVIKKGALTYHGRTIYKNSNLMNREEIIRHIIRISGDDPVVSTTGKISRELFEAREQGNIPHKYDFLTVGSMGHCSSIALGIALNKTDKKVWCIDGDGAAIMHMGAMAVIGQNKPSNLVHIIINNGAHETVGGMPTAALGMDWPAIAKACGYSFVSSVSSFEELDLQLARVKKSDGLYFIEAKASLGSRKDLERPSLSTYENKKAFMQHLHGI